MGFVGFGIEWRLKNNTCRVEILLDFYRFIWFLGGMI